MERLMLPVFFIFVPAGFSLRSRLTKGTKTQLIKSVSMT